MSEKVRHYPPPGPVNVRPIETRFGIRAPSAESIVETIASLRGETVVSHGAAINALGLTNHVPARVVYLPSGRSPRLMLGAQVVELKHAPGWQFIKAGESVGEVVHSLAWPGPAHAREALKILKPKLPESEFWAPAECPTMPYVSECCSCSVRGLLQSARSWLIRIHDNAHYHEWVVEQRRRSLSSNLNITPVSLSMTAPGRKETDLLVGHCAVGVLGLFGNLDLHRSQARRARESDLERVEACLGRGAQGGFEVMHRDLGAGCEQGFEQLPLEFGTPALDDVTVSYVLMTKPTRTHRERNS